MTQLYVNPIDTLPALAVKLVDPAFDMSPFLVDALGTLEVSVDLLSNSSPELALEAKEYWLSARRFHDDLSRGIEPENYQLTLRELASHVQSTNKGSKSDLVEQLHDLENIEPISFIIDKLLEPQFTNYAHPLIECVKLEKDLYEYQITLSGQSFYGTTLGGAPSRAEIARIFRLKVSYAKWRDRKVRRLVSVVVLAKEIWPALPN